MLRMCACSFGGISLTTDSGAQLSRGSRVPEMVDQWVLVCSPQISLCLVPDFFHHVHFAGSFHGPIGHLCGSSEGYYVCRVGPVHPWGHLGSMGVVGPKGF